MSEPEDRNWGLRTRAIHAGARPDPTTGARAVPIYQTTSFVFEDTADAADLFALQKYGNIYTPHRQPDRRGVRGAHRQPRGRHRRRGDGQRPGGGDARCSPRCASAGDHIVVELRALRRHVHAARRDAAPARHRDHVRRRRTTRPRSPPPCSPAARSSIYTEVIANPSGTVADLAGARRDVAHAAGMPLVVDATLATPVPVPADRARRRHRHPLGHEVPRRPRHLDRRRRRRVRPLPLGQRQLPGHDRAGRHLRRPALLGQLRRVRLPHQAARRAAAQPRRRAVAVQRVPAPAGHGDAAAADGRARRQRAGRRRVAGGRPARELGALRRAARRPRPRAGRSATCRRARARSSPSACDGGREAGEAFIERASSCARTSPTSATRARSSSTPARPRTASSPTRRWRPPACCPSSSASASASRTSTTSSATSTGRSPRRGRCLTPGAAERRASAARILRAHAHGRHRRRVGQPGARELLRRSRTCSRSSADYEVWFVTPRGPRSSACRPTRRWPTCPARPTSSTSSAAPDDLPERRRGGRRRRRRRRSGCSSGCTATRPCEIAHDAGLDVVIEPLPQDRARPLPRRPAPRRASTPASSRRKRSRG